MKYAIIKKIKGLRLVDEVTSDYTQALARCDYLKSKGEQASVEKIVKLANMELLECDVVNAISEGNIYIAKWKRIYQLHYSRNAGYYTTCIYEINSLKNTVPFTRKGRHDFIDGETVNRYMERDFVDATITSI